MEYTVELSFDLRKKGDLTATKRKLENESCKLGCTRFFYNYEVSGHNRTLNRSHYVMTFIFEANDVLVAKFIKFSKNDKFIKVESLSYEKPEVCLMYASKQYLNMMEKAYVKQYRTDKKAGLLYNKDCPIMKEIYAKK